jgi:hypothetical protein
MKLKRKKMKKNRENEKNKKNWIKEKNKNISIFFKVFLKGKNKYTLVNKFSPISNEKIIIT